MGENDMNADMLIQELAVQIYRPPLASVRDEANYPNLSNPLHLAVLLIDCDTEIEMNGILGFLENMTGRYLPQTTEALRLIGAPKCAVILNSVHASMTKHGVSSERLRGDFEGTTEFQITSFSEMHGDRLDLFTTEVDKLTNGLSIFNTRYSPEDAYGAFCSYLDGRFDELCREVDERKAQ
jgi:hypothetical protein